MLVASGNTQQSPRRLPLSVLTTISNCQAGGNDWVAAVPTWLVQCVKMPLSVCLQAKRRGILGLQPQFSPGLASLLLLSRP